MVRMRHSLAGPPLADTIDSMPKGMALKGWTQARWKCQASNNLQKYLIILT